MVVYQFWILCVVKYRSLRRADHSSRGVLPIVMCRNMISKPRQWGGLGPLEPSRYGKNPCINLQIQINTSSGNNIVNAGHRHQTWNLHYVRSMPCNYSHSTYVSKHTLCYGLGLVFFRKSGVFNAMLVAGRQTIGHKEHSQKVLPVQVTSMMGNVLKWKKWLHHNFLLEE